MTAAAPRHDAGDIARMLAFDMEALCRAVLPGGKRESHEWVHASLDGGSARSLSVHLGHKAENGVWKDFAANIGGDSLDLVAHVLYRGDKKAAFRWALNYLGLSNAPAHAGQAAAVRVADRKPAATAQDFRKAALALFLEARETIAGTPADAYLRHRGIDLSRLGKQPRALRFHPGCYCSEAQARFPALVAAVCDADGVHVATHRTWLQQRGGEWTKANLADPKKTLGRLHGGTIRLRRGGSNKTLREAPQGEIIAIGEGIETCLSVAIAVPEMRILCAVSMANAASIILPPQIGAVVLLADNDGANPAARKGLLRVMQHLGAQTELRIARSPWGKDFNDAIRAGTA